MQLKKRFLNHVFTLASIIVYVCANERPRSHDWRIKLAKYKTTTEPKVKDRKSRTWCFQSNFVSPMGFYLHLLSVFFFRIGTQWSQAHGVYVYDKSNDNPVSLFLVSAFWCICHWTLCIEHWAFGVIVAININEPMIYIYWPTFQFISSLIHNNSYWRSTAEWGRICVITTENTHCIHMLSGTNLEVSIL